MKSRKNTLERQLEFDFMKEKEPYQFRVSSLLHGAGAISVGCALNELIEPYQSEMTSLTDSLSYFGIGLVGIALYQCVATSLPLYLNQSKNK